MVIIAGSALMVEGWRDQDNAIMMGFYAGMEGGTAIAHLLFGRFSPSGKLPFTVARDAADSPFFDRDASEIDYGFWHGYAKLDHEAITPSMAAGAEPLSGLRGWIVGPADRNRHRSGVKR